MKTLSLSEAKMKFSQIVDEITSLSETVTVTKNGRPVVVMIDADEYESWKETQLILSDQEMMTEIREGLTEIERNSRLYTLEELFDG